MGTGTTACRFPWIRRRSSHRPSPALSSLHDSKLPVRFPLVKQGSTTADKLPPHLILAADLLACWAMATNGCVGSKGSVDTTVAPVMSPDVSLLSFDSLTAWLQSAVWAN